MWAITSYYNPAGFERRLSNYKIFRRNLAVPLVTVELSFDGHFALSQTDADILIQISGGAVLWQKERLLNVALKMVPPTVGQIAWIDCDVIFERRDWRDEAKRQLDEFNVVQLLSEQVDLKPEDNPSHFDLRDASISGRGIVSLINSENRQSDLPPPEKNRRSFAWGLAWAARRTILEEHGLYDAMIVGGGDRALVSAMYGQFEKVLEAFQSNRAREEHYLKWAHSYHRSVAGRVGYVAGRLFHLWHGDVEKRNYINRYRGLADADFELSDIFIGSNGAWHWARSKPRLRDFLKDHFKNRSEDGQTGLA